MGYPTVVFDSTVLPVMTGCSEFVQLLPARGWVGLDHPGGRFVHALELALRVLHLRRAYALPPAASPEVVGEYAHRWTYAAFVAALLDSSLQVASGLQVELVGETGDLGTWAPLAGSMTQAQAKAYRFRASSAASTENPEARSLRPRLYAQWVPSHVRAWITEDPRLAVELDDWLGCEANRSRSVLCELLQRASHPVPVAGTTDAGTGGGEEGARAESCLASHVASPRSEVRDVRASLIGADADSVSKRGRPQGPDPDGGEAGRGVTDRVVSDAPSRDSVANGFMRWLRRELDTGSMRLNVEGGLVHGVPEGMLLVSPKIFQAFACALRDEPANHGVRLPAAGGDPAKWVQREVLRARWHLRARAGGDLHRYIYQGGRRDGVQVIGVVVPDPERFLGALVPQSDMLCRLAQGRSES